MTEQQPVPKKNVGLRRIMLAGIYSWQGLVATFRHEAAFRQEVALSVVLAPLALWVGENALERGLLIGSLLIVLIIEILNSAVESIVDRMSPEHNELAGRAKDQGSAAVLIALLLVVVVWAAVIL
jgi:diacylglycerol kinase (ATP)